MVEDYCKSIKNLSCDVLSTIKPTLKISTADAQSCHVFSPYEFTAGTTLLCVKGLNHSGLNARPKYSLWSLDVDEIDLVTCRYFLHSFVVQEYEFQSMFYFDDKYPVFNQYTNDPSYFTGLLSSTMTMSIAGGQTNQYLTNPSYLAGLLSSTMTMSIAGGHTNQYLTNPSYLAGYTNQYLTNPSYLAGLLSNTMTMSIAGGHTNQYLTNPSYLTGLTMTMSIAGGHTNQHKNLSYFVATVNTISASDYNPAEESCTEEFSNFKLS
jgi:hypothetical protein